MPPPARVTNNGRLQSSVREMAHVARHEGGRMQAQTTRIERFVLLAALLSIVLALLD